MLVIGQSPTHLPPQGRSQTLERYLADSKAKEQRSREIAAALKQSYR